jgi:ACS family hexuronate transporter-like MFS transporter
MKELMVPLIIIYTVASFGGIMGGWLSSYLIKKGKSIDYSRKTAMMVCAICMLTITLVPTASRLWISILLLSLATAFHQGWSSNVFTLASDIFPKNVVARVVSLAGFIAAIAGALTAVFIGIVLQLTNSYTMLFAIAGSMYLISWFVLRIMIPEIEPMKEV